MVLGAEGVGVTGAELADGSGALVQRAREALSAKDYASAIKCWAALSRDEAVPDADAFAGVVTSLGVKKIKGYLKPGRENQPVDVRLNGRVIATTTACQKRKGGSPPTGFAVAVRRLWRYLGDGDVVTLTTTGEAPLLIDGTGPALRVQVGRKSRRKRLLRKLDGGFVFNKYGRLQRSLDNHSGYTGAMMQLFDSAARLIEDQYGYKVFIFYGTLLGCIRSANFIAHDDDIDVVYVSRHSGPEDVKAEFKDICRLLAANGYGVSVRPFGTKVRSPGESYRQSFGLHFGWVDEERRLHVAYGHHGEQYRVPSEMLFRPAQLGAFTVDVPTDSETILEMLYGPGWRIPDPGFSHHTNSRKNDPRYHLTSEEIAEFRLAEPSGEVSETNA